MPPKASLNANFFAAKQMRKEPWVLELYFFCTSRASNSELPVLASISYVRRTKIRTAKQQRHQRSAKIPECIRPFRWVQQAPDHETKANI